MVVEVEAVIEVEVAVVLAISDEKVMVGEKTKTVRKKVVAVLEKTESPRRSRSLTFPPTVQKKICSLKQVIC